jgi:hypothetical protein
VVIAFNLAVSIHTILRRSNAASSNLRYIPKPFMLGDPAHAAMRGLRMDATSTGNFTMSRIAGRVKFEIQRCQATCCFLAWSVVTFAAAWPAFTARAGQVFPAAPRQECGPLRDGKAGVRRGDFCLTIEVPICRRRAGLAPAQAGLAPVGTG